MAIKNRKQPKKVATLGNKKFCINYPDMIGPIISPIEKVIVNSIEASSAQISELWMIFNNSLFNWIRIKMQTRAIEKPQSIQAKIDIIKDGLIYKKESGPQQGEHRAEISKDKLIIRTRLDFTLETNITPMEQDNVMKKLQQPIFLSERSQVSIIKVAQNGAKYENRALQLKVIKIQVITVILVTALQQYYC